MGSASLEMSNCDFWCDTDGDKIESGAGVGKTKFVWRVKNFSARPEQKGEYIESGSFTVVSPKGVAAKCNLELYPNGRTSAKDGYMSVSLTVMDTKARVSYKIFIRDEHGSNMVVLAKSKGGVTEFDPTTADASWGRRNAILIDHLKE